MIQERALLAAVHISIWTAVKHDRGVSRDVAERNGAPMSAGRYNKQLLRGADKLDELRTLASQVRQYFYKITLPWTDEGYRLLPANLYFDLTARMRETAQIDRIELYGAHVEESDPEIARHLSDDLRLAAAARAPDVQRHTFTDQRMKRLVKLGWFHLDLPQSEYRFGREESQVGPLYVIALHCRIDRLGKEQRRQYKLIPE